MKPQRRISAKLICCRAPMIRAPITANRIKAYIASAERRVKSHMNISKLRPRLAKGRVRDLVAMSASQCRSDDRIGGDGKDRDEDRPLQPDRFVLVFPEARPQVEQRDP